jgi:hypothetical protein
VSDQVANQDEVFPPTLCGLPIVWSDFSPTQSVAECMDNWEDEEIAAFKKKWEAQLGLPPHLVTGEPESDQPAIVEQKE